MIKDKHRRDGDWFGGGGQDTSLEGRIWSAFEGDLFRGLKLMESRGHNPVIRMSEKAFGLLLNKKCTKVIGACWSVYMFRGYPIALRQDDMIWDVVEIMSDDGNSSSVFKVRQ